MATELVVLPVPPTGYPHVKHRKCRVRVLPAMALRGRAPPGLKELAAGDRRGRITETSDSPAAAA